MNTKYETNARIKILIVPNKLRNFVEENELKKSVFKSKIVPANITVDKKNNEPSCDNFYV